MRYVDLAVVLVWATLAIVHWASIYNAPWWFIGFAFTLITVEKAKQWGRDYL